MKIIQGYIQKLHSTPYNVRFGFVEEEFLVLNVDVGYLLNSPTNSRA
jgi:hypothetical protein